MIIEFFRGDNHQVKFKFKSYTGQVDKMYFTARDKNREVKITKSLGNGITKEGEYYIINFTPSDTNIFEQIIDRLVLIYDIEVIIADETYTIAKDKIILEEDITKAEQEV